VAELTYDMDGGEQPDLGGGDVVASLGQGA
jgi:hypothetical protein